MAINGFGRIGRNTFRAAFGNSRMKVVAINDLTSPDVLAPLLQYDSVFRTWPHKVSSRAGAILVEGKAIPVWGEKDPMLLPWKKEKIDVVVESTGFFTSAEKAKAHLAAGAKAVVITAPSEDVPTFLLGSNHDKLSKKDSVINMASCTTNSAAPVMAVLEEVFGIKKAMLSTAHSVTSGQNVVDGVPPGRKPDMRRARSVLGNIIPTDTGAAHATAAALPFLKGKFDGVSLRVPTPDVSLTTITALIGRKTTAEEVNAAFEKAAKSARWKGVLGVTDDPVVSSDFIGDARASVVDLGMTRVVDGDLVSVMAWYDNEWGYSVQLVRMIEEVGRRVCRVS